jgi:hypothetical protein
LDFSAASRKALRSADPMPGISRSMTYLGIFFPPYAIFGQMEPDLRLRAPWVVAIMTFKIIGFSKRCNRPIEKPANPIASKILRKSHRWVN